MDMVNACACVFLTTPIWRNSETEAEMAYEADLIGPDSNSLKMSGVVCR